MKTLSYCLAILFLGLCYKSDEVDVNIIVDRFPKNINLNATKIEIPPVLWEVRGMLIIDSFLIVMQPRVDTIGRIFHLPNCELVSSFGRHGKGPNEFMSIDNNTFKPFHASEDGFTMGNLGANIQYYRVKDFFNKELKPYKILKIPSSFLSFRAMANLGDSAFISAPYGGNDHIIRFHDKSNVVEKILDYPENFPNMDLTNKKNVFGCYMASKPDNTQFVITYASVVIVKTI